MYINKKIMEIYKKELKKEQLNEKTLKLIEEAEKFLEKHLENDRIYHLGYPNNLDLFDPVMEYLKFIESNFYMLDNVGDTYELGTDKLHTKIQEQNLLSLFYEKFGIENGWGYISSGGTESNKWGIREGFNRYPNGILYYCEAGHYSIYKFSSGRDYRIIKQTSELDESIDVDLLLKEVTKNWNTDKRPAILLLNWGTTKTGAIDDIETISKYLKDNNISYYIHLDAAHFGGIPNNQVNAPIVPKYKDGNYNSVSISMHKYLGISKINSVLISVEKPVYKNIDYIGTGDSTISGSRDFDAFSSYYRIYNLFNTKNKYEYTDNIDYVISLLTKNNISYYRNKFSNTLVFDKLPDEICNKYQLSTFSMPSGKKYTHIIITPAHTKEILEEFVTEINQYYIECN